MTEGPLKISHDEQSTGLRIGRIYKRNKGGTYKIIELAKLATDSSLIVVYVDSTDGGTWARTVKDFLSVATA